MNSNLPISGSFLIKCSLFFLGAFVNCWLSGGINYFFVSILFFVFGWVVTYYLSSYKKRLVHAFEFTFCILVFVSIIPSFYLNIINDNSQIFGDSGFFYRESVGQGDVSTRYFIGGVVLFTFFYDIFHYIGFEKEIYIGILANMTAASLSAVISLMCLDRVLSPNKNSLAFLITLLCLSGNFILMSTVHLRDIWILLTINFVFYSSLAFYSASFNPFRILLFFCQLFIYSIILFILRPEFFLVPAIIFSLAIFSRSIVQKDHSYLVLMFFTIFILFVAFGSYIWTVLTSSFSYYQQLAGGREAADASLGYKLIVSQPLPVRLSAGLYFLLYYPIPVFAGKPLLESYDLFKMLNGIYNYFIIPAFIVAFMRISKLNGIQKFLVLFASLVVIVFAALIALTSLESRHFGVFLMPILLTILVQDWRDVLVKRLYVQTFICSFLLIYLVHLLWGQLKLF